VRGYTASESNEWKPSVTQSISGSGPFAGWFTYSATASKYTDGDYVVISDFEAGDKIRLTGQISDYWIGKAPSSSGLSEKNNISPGFPPSAPNPPSLESFGIYRANGVPNLVAHVQVKGFSLSNSDISAGNYAFAPNFGQQHPTFGLISSTDIRFGWGEFYKLDGSSIAANISLI